MEAPPRTLRGPGAQVIASLAAFAFLACLRRIGSPDYWTHLALGRAFVSAGTIVLPEQLTGVGAAHGGPPAGISALLRGAATIPEWPFQLALYGLRSAGGDAAVSVAIAVLAAAVVAMLCRPLLREGRVDRLALAAVFVAAAVSAARFRFTPRPEAIGAVLLAAVLLLAYSWGERPRWSALGWMAAILAVWSVVHVTWTLGALFAAAAIAGRPRMDFWRAQPRPVGAAAFALAALAGLPAARFARIVVTEMRGEGRFVAVTEMRPTWEFPSLLWPFAIVAVAGLALAWGREEGRRARLAVWGAAALVGIVVVRNVAFAALAMIPGALQGLTGFARRTPSRSRGVIYAAASAASVVAMLALALRDRDQPFGIGVDWRQFPRAAAEYVSRSPLEGPIFNSWVWGGYLAWAWKGERRTFLDGRLASRAAIEDDDELESGDPSEVLERRGFRTVLLQPVFQSSGRLLPAVGWFMSRPDWKLVDASDALVFTRVPLPEGVREAPYDAAWRAVLASADLAADQNDVGGHVEFTRAIALLELGDARGALDAYRRGMRRSPDVGAQYGMLATALGAAVAR